MCSFGDGGILFRCSGATWTCGWGWIVKDFCIRLSQRAWSLIPYTEKSAESAKSAEFKNLADFADFSTHNHPALHWRDAPSLPFTVSTRLAYHVRQPQEVLVLHHSYITRNRIDRPARSTSCVDLPAPLYAPSHDGAWILAPRHTFRGQQGPQL